MELVLGKPSSPAKGRVTRPPVPDGKDGIAQWGSLEAIYEQSEKGKFKIDW